MQIRRARRRVPHIDMTPLIDCIFQLLIFFMLSSTFLSPSIRLTLPTARPQAALSEQQSLIVSIDRAGLLFLNNDPAAWEQLDDRLRPLVEKSENKVVLVRCDEAAPHRYFVRALNAAKAAGAAHVQVAYQPETNTAVPRDKP